MNRIFVFLMGLTMISLLFGFMGVTTFGGRILGVLGINNDISIANNNDLNIANAESSGFWTDALSLFGLFSLVSIVVIGIFTRSITKIPAGVLFTGTLAVFIGDFIAIFNVLATYNIVVKYIAAFLIVPLLLGYMYSIVQWFMEYT